MKSFHFIIIIIIVIAQISVNVTTGGGPASHVATTQRVAQVPLTEKKKTTAPNSHCQQGGRLNVVKLY